jgi:hypothetical protein
MEGKKFHNLDTRMKRREKEYARKPQSRMWYFQREDWINSDEIVEGDKGENEAFFKPGNPYRRGILSTINLLIKIVCLEKKNFFNI